MTPFDRLASSYDELLRDPVRDRFSGRDSLFFHLRKADLIRRFFARRNTALSGLRYLDVGCGKGELLQLLQPDFKEAAGCDPSAGMLQESEQAEVRVQHSPIQIPFADGHFDVVTAVCVYHHVAPADRPGLTAEIRRVLRPQGIFCMIEHNPFNPATRLIVSRTPVDEDAILLRAGEARRLVVAAGMKTVEQDYFLYLPKALYRYAGRRNALRFEEALARVPLGGQYAIFSSKA